jgi:hypothetical protein
MIVAEQNTRKRDFSFLSESNAVGPAGKELRNKSEQELENAAKQSVFWSAAFLRHKAQSQIYSLAELRSNWDSYGAPAPNDIALENANRILKLMRPFDLPLTNIVASAEGGIGFCFVLGKRYADIESSNEGEIIGVRYVGMEAPVLIQTDGTDDSIKAALQEIRNHVGT